MNVLVNSFPLDTGTNENLKNNMSQKTENDHACFNAEMPYELEILQKFG